MNLEALNAVIERSGKTKAHLAKVLSLSPQGLYNKLHGRSEFTVSEIGTLCEELNITSVEERELIFFSPGVG